ncbi:MAG TPA: helix-turn-helix transcriptional regulator, partial [Gammaproteobacteria bacterium]|nr:helix-turn-helix transcriptional regulator [Gammaproteobacteria bacterium]
RERLGMSQEERAARCDLHRNAIGLVEHGERSPALETVIAIANGLGTKASRLVAKLESKL